MWVFSLKLRLQSKPFFLPVITEVLGFFCQHLCTRLGRLSVSDGGADLNNLRNQNKQQQQTQTKQKPPNQNQIKKNRNKTTQINLKQNHHETKQNTKPTNQTNNKLFRLYSKCKTSYISQALYAFSRALFSSTV